MDIIIPVENGILKGILCRPFNAIGLVLFSHGSGSSRLSPRNQYVANNLNKAKFATLLVDLLTEEEESVDAVTTEFRFNIPLLAQRLVSATQWVLQQKNMNKFPIGYFGASTGSAAALIAATHHPSVKAIVSRGGRPDLAEKALLHVTAPTLLIVGGNDPVVIDLNQKALSKMTCQKELTIIPNATHLFEEKGALEEVATLAKTWFNRHLP